MSKDYDDALLDGMRKAIAGQSVKQRSFNINDATVLIRLLDEARNETKEARDIARLLFSKLARARGMIDIDRYTPKHFDSTGLSSAPEWLTKGGFVDIGDDDEQR